MKFANRITEARRICHEDAAIHRRWYEWQERTPDWRDEADPLIGDPAHHREWEARYKMIHQLLGELRDALTEPEQPVSEEQGS